MMTRPQKRISLFADSLALPRGKDWGDIAFEDTYPYLLEKELRKKSSFENFIFINRAQRFRTIRKTLEDFLDFAVLPSSDFVIIHCGIVDCAPRVFTSSQREAVSRLPMLLRGAVVMLSRVLRKWIIQLSPQKKSYVSLNEFKTSIHSILSAQRDAETFKFILINIIVPPDDIEERSPGFQESAYLYNQVIDQAARTFNVPVVDLNNYVLSNGGHHKLTVDGMHVNAIGHKYISSSLLELIGE